MKKIKEFAALLSLIFAIFFFVSQLSQYADARITGDPPTVDDTFCVGPSGKEMCLNDGDIIPTSSGGGDLGTSTFKWGTVNAENASFDNFTLPDGSVTTDKLGGGAVTSPKIDDAAVTTNKLSDGAVTGPKIDDAAVTTGKIGDGSVTTSKLSADVQAQLASGGVADGEVTTAKIGDGAVTTPKLNNAAVQLKHLDPSICGASGVLKRNAGNTAYECSTIATANITAGNVTAASLQNGSVVADKINTGAVTTAKILNDSVTTTKLIGSGLNTPGRALCLKADFSFGSCTGADASACTCE